MTGEAMLVVCAMGLLGLRPDEFPPIELIRERPDGVSAGAEAFVRRDPDRIFLMASGKVFQQRGRRDHPCSNREAVIKLSSILVHERVHLVKGADERNAYQAQLTILTHLGRGPGTPLYSSVRKAMLAVLRQTKRNERGRIAMRSLEDARSRD
jgi:hypothetical protein